MKVKLNNIITKKKKSLTLIYIITTLIIKSNIYAIKHYIPPQVNEDLLLNFNTLYPMDLRSIINYIKDKTTQVYKQSKHYRYQDNNKINIDFNKIKNNTSINIRLLSRLDLYKKYQIKSTSIKYSKKTRNSIYKLSNIKFIFYKHIKYNYIVEFFNKATNTKPSKFPGYVRWENNKYIISLSYPNMATLQVIVKR